MAKDLFFLNPEIRDGQINTTVRRGDTWFQEVEIGDPINLKKNDDDEVLNTAEVVGKMQIVFELIPECYLAYQNSDKRNIEDLTAAMIAAHPDFTVGEIVTVLFFIPALLDGEEAPILLADDLPDVDLVAS